MKNNKNRYRKNNPLNFYFVLSMCFTFLFCFVLFEYLMYLMYLMSLMLCPLMLYKKNYKCLVHVLLMFDVVFNCWMWPQMS